MTAMYSYYPLSSDHVQLKHTSNHCTTTIAAMAVSTTQHVHRTFNLDRSRSRSRSPPPTAFWHARHARHGPRALHAMY